TRQMVSVPAVAEPRLPQLDGDGIRVLSVSRHGNKLKPGHLHGNRFRILVRDVAPEAAQRLAPLLERLRRDGLPNFYGPERFDRRETVSAGPIFGKKTFPAAALAAERESATLLDAGLTPAALRGFGKLLQGTRRHNLIYVDDLTGAVEADGVRLTFTLPAG